MTNEQRLQKVIAEAGIASRRKAETLITSGHVTVNHQVVTALGTKVTLADHVEVDGQVLHHQKLATFLFYKPRGVVSTVQDEHQRRTIADYFNELPLRVYPVGRLDYDTSGAILVTNDGDLAHQLMHPRFKVDKTYLAKVQGIPTPEELKKLQRGIVIKGRKTAPAKATIYKTDIKKHAALVRLTIHEGRNHQVKLMLQAIGHPVEKLKREKFAGLDLSGLISGHYRELEPAELSALKKLVSKSRQTK